MKDLKHGVMAFCATGALGFSMSGIPTTAFADNLLGAYAGLGVGQSTVRSDYGFDPDYPTDSHPHHTAYQVIAGIRPIPFVGAEAEYIDFGHDSSDDGYFDHFNSASYNADSHPKAGVLSAVGYLPLPFVDVFGKVGVARLETNLNNYSYTSCVGATPVAGCDRPVLDRQDAYQTKIAYGGGAQAHFFGSLALRAEYQRINSSYGDPDAFLVSATWTF